VTQLVQNHKQVTLSCACCCLCHRCYVYYQYDITAC